MEKDKTKYDAIVLAGDTGASRKVYGKNKVFLEINGIPLFLYVLNALEKADKVDRICLTGPREQLVSTIENHHHFLKNKKELIILEQGDSLYSNAWQSFLHLYPEAQELTSVKSNQFETAVLYISGDIPLVTPFEIDTFISLCELDRHDYCLGITSDDILQHFYPKKNTPGININYFHLSEGRYRQNNLNLVKPLRVQNRHYIQKAYDYRYQRDLRNIIQLAIEFLKVHVGLEGFRCYTLLHWNQLLSRMHLDRLTLPTRKALPLSFINRFCSRMLGTRFTTVISPLAGATLDLDNEKDYKTMCEMFTPWEKYLKETEEKLKEKHSQSDSLSGHSAA